MKETLEILRSDFAELKEEVKTMRVTLFGEAGAKGLVHQIDDILKVADGIKWVLTKIFIAICTAIGIAVSPPILMWFAGIISKHAGG